MSLKKNRRYYDTPLNTSKNIELPSNLLQGRPSTRYQDTQVSNVRERVFSQNETVSITPRTTLDPMLPQEHKQMQKEEAAKMIEEKQAGRRSVLYKRLTDIKKNNDSLERYSFSKLLSKMVVVDEQQNPYRSIQADYFNNQRTSSQYSCLRGRLVNIDCEEEGKGEEKEMGKKKRNLSRAEDWASRTTRIFKRFYVPSSEKPEAEVFGQPVTAQKYIYINGKKTECRRIHNFYSSQSYKTSYGKAFGRTKAKGRCF